MKKVKTIFTRLLRREKYAYNLESNLKSLEYQQQYCNSVMFAMNMFSTWVIRVKLHSETSVAWII